MKDFDRIKRNFDDFFSEGIVPENFSFEQIAEMLQLAVEKSPKAVPSFCNALSRRDRSASEFVSKFINNRETADLESAQLVCFICEIFIEVSRRRMQSDKLWLTGLNMAREHLVKNRQMFKKLEDCGFRVFKIEDVQSEENQDLLKRFLSDKASLSIDELERVGNFYFDLGYFAKQEIAKRKEQIANIHK